MNKYITNTIFGFKNSNIYNLPVPISKQNETVLSNKISKPNDIFEKSMTESKNINLSYYQSKDVSSEYDDNYIIESGKEESINSNKIDDINNENNDKKDVKMLNIELAKRENDYSEKDKDKACLSDNSDFDDDLFVI